MLAFCQLYANNDYCISTDTYMQNSNRYLTSFTFNDGTNSTMVSVNQTTTNGLPIYFDRTSTTFTTKAGATISSTFAYTGIWMSSYIYIDYNQDGIFTVDLDNTTGIPTETSELIAFSSHQIGNIDTGNWKNHLGQSGMIGADPKTPRETQPFVLPSYLAPGSYRVRVKIDLSSDDPCGVTNRNPNVPSIGGLAGTMVDFTMIIEGDDKNDYAVTITDDYSKEWILDWIDDFDTGVLDETVWSRIEKGDQNSDWIKNMSTYDGCYDFTESELVLKGIVNPGYSITGDNRQYLCGGIWSHSKKGFNNGKIEVRAKYGSAQGAWPAIWMIPMDQTLGWPTGGEIDLMEHLNYESKIYQTLHTDYTQKVTTTNPRSAVEPYINSDIYNTYGVIMAEDTLKLLLNDNVTLAYPNLNITTPYVQYPFDKEFMLILDMQLGGSWVGNVTGSGLPVDMYIDWVKFYKQKETGGKLTLFDGDIEVKTGTRVNEGTILTVVVTPMNNYELDQIIHNDIDITHDFLNNADNYTIEATNDIQLSAKYKLKKVNIKYNSIGNGHITLKTQSGDDINDGDQIDIESAITIDFIPNESEAITSFIVNDEDHTADIKDNKYSMIADKDLNIETVFSESTGINKAINQGIIAYSYKGNIAIYTPSKMIVNLYNASGMLLEQASVDGKFEKQLNAGIYIIKVGDAFVKSIVIE